MRFQRRRFLKLTGASTATAATGTAGCLDILGGGGDAEAGDPPAYTQWLGFDENDEVFYTYLNWAKASQWSESDDEESSDDMPDDPMLGLPISGVFMAAFAMFGLQKFNLGGLMGDSEAAASFETEVTEILIDGRATIFMGDVVADEIDQALTSEPESSFGTQYEQSDSVGDFDIYTSTGSGSTNAIALGGDAIVMPSDTEEPVAVLETVVGTRTGDGSRAVDENDDLKWLTATAGTGDIVMGGYGDGVRSNDSDGEGRTTVQYESLQDAEGGVASLAFESESGPINGELAAIVPDADEDSLRSTLGSSAGESTVEFDGDRVTASATWEDAEALQ